MKVSYVKKHAAAMAGDTTGRSKMEREFMLDYINWAVQKILARVRKGGKDYAFMRGTHTIDTTTDAGGTTGDYILPSDFGSVANAGGSGGGTDDLTLSFDGVTNAYFKQATDGDLRDRNFYTTYYNNTSREWHIRFRAVDSVSPTSYTIDYKKRQPRLVDNDDEIIIFPPDEGWEQVVIYGTAAQAYRYNKESFALDPAAEFEVLIEERLEELNADSPDEQVRISISEHDKYYYGLAADRYGDSGGFSGI